MRFRPITSKYKFDSKILTKDYPDYLKTPIANWIVEVLSDKQIWSNSYGECYISEAFLSKLDITFREHFPRDSSRFLSFVFQDSDRATNLIGFILQNLAYRYRANALEIILATAGSTYAVSTDANTYPSEYDEGVADLVERVPVILAQASEKALSEEPLLQQAWHACYSRNPDYEKTVSRCCDVLEKVLNKYFPADQKPQLKKFVHAFKKTPALLAYKGSPLVEPKNIIFDIAEKFSDIRGQHTAGKGRIPTKEEAEFVLHYSIFIWNLEK